MPKEPKVSEIDLKCVCCGAGIDEVPGSPDSEASSSCWDGAVVDKICGGYGSKHDMSLFIIGICDKCVSERIESGLLIRFRTMDDMLESPEFKAQQAGILEIIRDQKGNAKKNSLKRFWRTLREYLINP